MLVELIIDARFKGEAKRIIIQFVLETKLLILVQGHQVMLNCAKENVLRNAIKYSPQGSVVNVILSKYIN